jgi:plastocyanin
MGVLLVAGVAGVGVAVLPSALADNQSVTAGGSSYGYATNRFAPMSVAVKPGETVTWSNAGGTHNVEFDDASLNCTMPPAPAQPAGWGGGTGKVSCKFPNSGTFTYHCHLHGPMGMTGTVYVNSSGTVPTSTTPPPTTGTTPTNTNPYVPPPTTPTSPPGGGPTVPQGSPTVSALQVGSHRHGNVSGQVEIGQGGSRFEADLLKGAGSTTASTAKGTSKNVLGQAVKASVPAGTLQFQVALNRRGRKLVSRKGHVKLILKVTVTPPGGAAKSASTHVKLAAH